MPFKKPDKELDVQKRASITKWVRYFLSFKFKKAEIPSPHNIDDDEDGNSLRSAIAFMELTFPDKIKPAKFNDGDLYFKIMIFSAAYIDYSAAELIKNKMGFNVPRKFEDHCFIQTSTNFKGKYDRQFNDVVIDGFKFKQCINNIAELTEFMLKVLDGFPTPEGLEKDDTTTDAVYVTSGAIHVAPEAAVKSRATLWVRLHELACEAERLTINQ